LILLKAFNSLPSVLTVKQFNCELEEVLQFLVCTAMTEVPGMNIIKFADSLGMLVVNLNIRMCLFVFAPENQLLIAEFGL